MADKPTVRIVRPDLPRNTLLPDERPRALPSVTGSVKRIGGATLACPKCGAELRTEHALIRAEIPNGLQFKGLACAGCGSSFTVEMTETPT